VVDPTSPSNQLVGAVLNGRFRLVRLLGEGGMGAVFEADGLRGEGKRAIKLLHPEFTNEPQVVSRFFAEADAVQSLSHPNIAKVYELARAEDGTPYMVMELLHGVTLTAFISKHEPMPMQHATPIIHEILQALTLAHARRIVHRDLKPDNVFLVRDARGAYSAKVLDFGIAKVMDAAGGMGGKTRTGALLGTPGYMSPEQIKNSKSVDPRSDLWSLGAMFYELVTGCEPFPADNDFARLTATITTDVRPVEQIAPHLAAWGQFFRRALAKDPAARFQSAEEMDHSLMLLASGGPQVPEWSAAPTPRAAAAAVAGPNTEAPVGVARPQIAAFAPGTNGAPGQPQAHAQHVATATAGGTVAMAVVPSPPASPQMGQTTTPIQAQPMMHTPMPIQAQQLPGIPGGPVPISIVSSPSPMYAPQAGSPGAVVNTHVSAQRPGSTPTYTGGSALPVEIVEPSPYHRGPPWWMVGVIAFVCTALGFVVGMLAAG
jgi:eukaryotic-like serine/threonine-protein kinase